MLSKKYWTGLQEPHIRDGKDELYKPHLIFVKDEGRGLGSNLGGQTVHPPLSLTPPIY